MIFFCWSGDAPLVRNVSPLMQLQSVRKIREGFGALNQRVKPPQKGGFARLEGNSTDFRALLRGGESAEGC